MVAEKFEIKNIHNNSQTINHYIDFKISKLNFQYYLRAKYKKKGMKEKSIIIMNHSRSNIISEINIFIITCYLYIFHNLSLKHVIKYKRAKTKTKNQYLQYGINLEN
jgi:hypothetical protein